MYDFVLKKLCYILILLFNVIYTNNFILFIFNNLLILYSFYYKKLKKIYIIFFNLLKKIKNITYIYNGIRI